MQRDTPWPTGTPCWVDLGTDDVARATTFYSTLFGWHVETGPPEAGGYVMCMRHGRPVAGIGQKMGPAEVPTAWTTYLASDDVDATTSQVAPAAAAVLADPFEVMDVGRMSMATDPGGAAFGIWQARTHYGMGLANEPGAVCWNENMSRSFDANESFYAKVFGYSYDDMSSDEFKYATFKTGANPMGGIGELSGGAPAETPAHWMTYFGVDDTDEAAEVATKLGGNVMQAPWDTPYGRMAILADDQGAVFAVMAMSQASGQ